MKETFTLYQRGSSDYDLENVKKYYSDRNASLLLFFMEFFLLFVELFLHFNKIMEEKEIKTIR